MKRVPILTLILFETLIFSVKTFSQNIYGGLNEKRVPTYIRFDLRIDRRYYFRNWNIVTYFDMMNVFNRDNIWAYDYDDDGTKEIIKQWKVMPVGGIVLEF